MAKRTITRLLIAGFGLAALASPAPAAELAVPRDHPTLAAALAVAGAHDTITLAPGSHVAANLTVTVGVTIRGGGTDPAATVLDAGGLGRILLLEDVPDTTVLMNLTFRGGLAAGSNSHAKSGGAVFVRGSPLRIENCAFEDNVAEGNGGALRAIDGATVVRDCRFAGNRSVGAGGGAIAAEFQASVLIDGCDLEGNTARWGGAVSVRAGGTVSLVDCRLVGNVAGGEPALGGGLFVDYGAVAGLVETVLSGNTARAGGAAACLAGSMVNLGHATLVENVATERGGGLLLVDAAPFVVASIIAFNQGDAISLVGDSAPYVSCSDIYGNSGEDWSAELLAMTDMNLNFAVDPEFCSLDPLALDGLHLSATSPLLVGDKGCDMPGLSAQPCGATSTPIRPVARGFLSAGAFPNPFNPQTIASFETEMIQRVRIAVYDVRGRRVRHLADRIFPPGEHRVAWDGRDDTGRSLGSGAYYIAMEGESDARTVKVTLLK